MNILNFALTCVVVISQRAAPLIAQRTELSDNTCLYSFAVPRGMSPCVGDWTASGRDESRQKISELQSTVTALHEQLAALMTIVSTQSGQLLQRITQLETQTANLQLQSNVVSTTSRSDQTTSPHSNQPSSSSGGGVTYTRWGRTVCPAGDNMVYKGYSGGSYYAHTGGTSHYLCMPEDPEWGKVVEGAQTWASYIHGVEYELEAAYASSLFSNTHNGGQSLHDNDAPCVVCHVPNKSSMLMIPAKRNCTDGWRMEYVGYLVSEYSGRPSRTEHVCLDEAPEVVPGGLADRNGGVFYPVQAACGSLPCPKYVNNRELACVVCTK